MAHLSYLRTLSSKATIISRFCFLIYFAGPHHIECRQRSIPFRPSNGSTSEAKAFTYTPQDSFDIPLPISLVTNLIIHHGNSIQLLACQLGRFESRFESQGSYRQAIRSSLLTIGMAGQVTPVELFLLRFDPFLITISSIPYKLEQRWTRLEL